MKKYTNKFKDYVLNNLPEEEIESCINECIEEFNFFDVAKIFKLMKYQWVNKNGDLYIPTIKDLKIQCTALLSEAFAQLILSKNDHYCLSTGRFKVTTYRTMYNNSVHYDCKIEFIPVESY